MANPNEKKGGTPPTEPNPAPLEKPSAASGFARSFTTFNPADQRGREEVPAAPKRGPVGLDAKEHQERRIAQQEANSARLNAAIRTARPVLFTRRNPARPSEMQFMTLVSATVREDGTWKGWVIHPDRGLVEADNANNHLGNWELAGYYDIETPSDARK